MRIRSRHVWGVMAAFAASAGFAAAQDPPASGPVAVERRQVVPFLQGTYVFLTIPRDRIKFEADIQPNFVISQNFTDQLVIDEVLEGRNKGKFKRARSFVGTPRVRLREFDARSAPVRTPSYMPKGSYTEIFFRGERRQNDTARVGLWALQTTVGHHSNGQDGCLFTSDDLKGDDCVGTPDLTRINKKDGSFSTNFVKVGGRYRREWLKDVSTDEQKRQGLEEQMGTHEVTLSLDIQRHFHTDPRLKPFYGTTRAEVSLGAATRFKKVCKSRVGASATLFYVGEQPPDVNSFAFQGEASCIFNDQGGWGAFVRFYGGQDYYNLGFAESITRVMVGAQFEQDGFLRFLSSKAKAAADAQRRQREAR